MTVGMLIVVAIVGVLVVSAALGVILRHFEPGWTRWEAFVLGVLYLLIGVGVLGAVALLVSLVVSTWGVAL